MQKTFIYILFLAITSNLMSQNERQLTVSEIRQQSIIEEPINLQKGYFRFGSGLFYDFSSFDGFDENWKKKNSFNNFNNTTFNFPVNIRYGITNKFEIDLSTSYKKSTTSSSVRLVDNYSDEITDFKAKDIVNGFADLGIGTVTNIYDGGNKFPSISLFTSVLVPYGKRENTFSDDSTIMHRYTTEGAYQVGGGYYIKKTFYPFMLTHSSAYYYNFQSDIKLYADKEKTTVKKGSIFSTYIEFHYLPCEWLDLYNVIIYANIGSNEYSNEKYQSEAISREIVTWQPRLNLQIKNLRLIQGFNFALIGRNYPSNPSYVIILEIKI